jgi:hypothetical protein
MATALHLLKAGERPEGGAPDLMRATIEEQLAAGDTVTVVALHGAAPPALPAGVTLRRLPGELVYDELLEAIFQADQVIAW